MHHCCVYALPISLILNKVFLTSGPVCLLHQQDTRHSLNCAKRMVITNIKIVCLNPVSGAENYHMRAAGFLLLAPRALFSMLLSTDVVLFSPSSLSSQNISHSIRRPTSHGHLFNIIITIAIHATYHGGPGPLFHLPVRKPMVLPCPPHLDDPS